VKGEGYPVEACKARVRVSHPTSTFKHIAWCSKGGRRGSSRGRKGQEEWKKERGGRKGGKDMDFRVESRKGTATFAYLLVWWQRGKEAAAAAAAEEAAAEEEEVGVMVVEEGEGRKKVEKNIQTQLISMVAEGEGRKRAGGIGNGARGGGGGGGGGGKKLEKNVEAEGRI
jgi:hypothetical protein